jgi:hypothetical protein
MKRHAKIARVTLASALALVGSAIALVSACGPSGFQSATVIDSVRILATRVDHDEAYARPGDTVTLETLTVDGRTNKTPPAVTYWLPFLCVNPVDDLYYACFASLIGGDDAGADGGTITFAGGGDAGADDAGADGSATPTPTIPASALAGLLKPGTDLTPFLPTGPFTFQVPADIVASHPVQQGIDPYGLVIVFNIACAGHVEVAPTNAANGPQQIPIGCYDDAGTLLDPDQYVIGFTRVYASTTKSDTNPVITGFHFNDAGIPIPDAGGANPAPIAVSMPACDASSCTAANIDIDVPASSWVTGKSIWVEYFARGGSLSDEGRLLYDPNAGLTPDPKNPLTYSPPTAPGPATIWAVVHDSNDGVTWVEIDVTATK